MIPKGWQDKTLGEICTFLGKGKRKASFGNDTGIYKFIPSALVEKKCDAADYSGEYIVLGDGGIANIHYLNEPFSASDHTYILQKKQDIEMRFVYYSLLSCIDFIQKGFSGAAIKNVSKKYLTQIPVNIPQLAEQQRIVAKLDKAFEAIDKAKAIAETNLKNAKELYESFLNNAFTKNTEEWEEKKLGEVCKITSKLIDPKLPQNQNLLHVGAANIEQKNGNLVNLMTAKEEKLISNKFIFDNKMVLYSKIRPYLMKVVRPNFTGLCSADIYPLLPDTKYITRDYLFYLLLSKPFTDYAIEGSARAGMPKVNRPHLFAYSCKLPTVYKQQTIVEKLDALQEQTKQLEQIYTQKIKACDELKQSILNKAFKGEL